MPKRLCACGCGEEIPIARYPSWQKEYVNVGHFRRDKHYWDIKATIICACGCGEEMPKYDYRGRERIFKHGHNIVVLERSAEWRQKISIANKAREYVVTDKMRAANAKRRGKPIPHLHNPEVRAKIKVSKIANMENQGVWKRLKAKVESGYRTDIEQMLEDILQEQSIKYLFEHRLGRYFVDFFLPDHNLVVEADGVIYHRTEKQLEKDARKNAYLESKGYNVVRLWGSLIRNGFAWDHLERELYWQRTGT
jgi:very-short-patch-repair endonuclease